ncbi:MAG TPA: hypothetical protein VGM90_04740 [Kofleriaceae bacterium]|jgi:predicted tellurium resistance membrane protein TerC
MAFRPPPQREAPKALFWGLAGGMVLFTIILIVLILTREPYAP